MSDMPSDFWAGWISVITIVSFIGLAWLVFSIYFAGDSEAEEAEGPIWDENLREGNNPAPMWWFWMVLALMVFSVIYLMLYPGLGSYAGALKWSQGGRLDDSFVEYQHQFGGIRNLIAEGQLETLRADEALVASAQRVFDRNCAVCHGYDAAGQADSFPDLTDADWQWGGTPMDIELSIRNGRNAVMVGWAAILGDDGVVQMADYVSALGGGDVAERPADAQYKLFCVACHGVDGTGNAALGAPDLTDDVWLYGNGADALQESIGMGRNGQMPAFGERLDKTQIRLLVMLLSESATVAE